VGVSVAQTCASYEELSQHLGINTQTGGVLNKVKLDSPQFSLSAKEFTISAWAKRNSIL
jgi:hypothetical protein